MVTIQLTQEQLDRLTTIVSCHLDLNIDAGIQKAMKAGNVGQTKTLMTTKEQDSNILQALYAADRAARK